MEPNDFTTLVLDGIGIAPYSARGISQTLEPIDDASHLERTVNGEFIDLSIPELRKFKISITCTDQEAPALSGIWPGTAFTLQSVVPLSYPTAEPDRKERPSVDGSEYSIGDYTSYRPVLSMVCTSFKTGILEYGREINWQLEAEEA